MIVDTRETQTNQLTDEEGFAAVDRTMERFNYREDGLVEVLITAQEAFGFLSKDLLTYISNNMRIPLSRIYGVATFYDMFRHGVHRSFLHNRWGRGCARGNP
jgi:bidirectional [NiFe] hydrogenase diaphorase subunit